MAEFSDKQIQIMEAAEKLFAQKGFAGTSVRDIAEAAEINVAMVSYYFGSKEKLMEALFHYRSQFFILQLQNMVQNKSLTPIQKVEQLIEQYILKLTTQSDFHCIMVREQMVDHNSFLTKQIQDMKQRNQLVIKELIVEGQKSGDFKNNVDVQLMMMTMIGTVSQLVTTQRNYRLANSLQNVEDPEFLTQLQKRLSTHLKNIFKAILINEA